MMHSLAMRRWTRSALVSAERATALICPPSCCPNAPVRRLLLRAPALYDDEMFDVPLAYPRQTQVDAAAPQLIRALHEFRGEILVLESGADETIPHSVVEWYLHICRSARHQVIEGASHALTTEKWRQAFLTEIVIFFHGL